MHPPACGGSLEADEVANESVVSAMSAVFVLSRQHAVELVLGVLDGCGDLEAELAEPGSSDGHEQCRDAASTLGQVALAGLHQLRTRELGRQRSHEDQGTG